ncbi:MAG: hypothetical protein IPN16_13325 [Gemmatimonadetes bacterium]|nr:hypothetical protein [Gemmatimonadota bacterium]
MPDNTLPTAVILDVEQLFERPMQQARLGEYEQRALSLAGEGRDIVITGRGPIWLYLRLAHELHGVARTLTYRSPEAGDVLVFDHRSR